MHGSDGFRAQHLRYATEVEVAESRGHVKFSEANELSLANHEHRGHARGSDSSSTQENLGAITVEVCHVGADTADTELPSPSMCHSPRSFLATTYIDIRGPFAFPLLE